jgi:hypothetical protein
METKTILIILIVYYLFFYKISENFSSPLDCLSTVAGRMLWQKESLDEAIESAKIQKKCLNKNHEITTKNRITSWKPENDCYRFLNDAKSPDDKSARNWFNTCIMK